MAQNELPHREQQDLESSIRELKRQAELLSGGPMSSGGTSNLPLELQERFWKHIVAFELAEQAEQRSPPSDDSIRGEVDLPAPDTLSDEAVSVKLWEVIRGLAERGTILHHTDHLSDRDLYADLWSDARRELATAPGFEPGTTCHLDIIGSGSEDDNLIFLRYYADDSDREHWASQWPEEPMPPREQPRFDRDRLLPQEPTTPSTEYGAMMN